jgi:hypothetical protein
MPALWQSSNVLHLCSPAIAFHHDGRDFLGEVCWAIQYANRSYRAGNSLRAACHGVLQVLDANSLHWKHSRDTTVLALSLLFESSLNYDYLSMPIPPQIFVVVAVRAGYILTHDSFPSYHKWYLMTHVRSRSLSHMGPFFLQHVQDAGLLSEDEYQDFEGRPEVVWLMIKDIKLGGVS